MWRYLTLFGAGAVVVLSGAVHGKWTGRWGDDTALEDAVARLGRIPLAVGDWRGADQVLGREETEAARIAGYCYRRYENLRSRHAVTVLLACGRPGPIAVHTPDICFEGAGYRRLAPPAPCRLAYGGDDRAAGFRTMRMRQAEAASPTELRIFWSWSAGGAWQAPDNPRVAFARRRALYKLYVLREYAGEEVRPEDDPCAEFLRALLPALDAALAEASARPDGT
jgi:hypothetical protein